MKYLNKEQELDYCIDLLTRVTRSWNDQCEASGEGYWNFDEAGVYLKGKGISTGMCEDYGEPPEDEL